MTNFSFDVSVVIVNYKTHRLVADCLNSIKEKSESFSYEIIVVDNSQDPTEFKALTDLQNLYENLKVIDAKSNLGFGRANNLGARCAKGRCLLFLNSDTVLLNNAVFKMLEMFQKADDIGGVGANLYGKNGRPAHSYVKHKMDVGGLKKTNSMFAILKRRFGFSDQFNKSRRPIEIKGYITGACIMIPQTVFWQVGGFDSDIFMYGEDVLLCTLIRGAGYRLFNTPDAKVLHLEGGSDERVFSDFKIRNYVDGIRIYAQKAFGRALAKEYLKAEMRIYKRAALRNRLLRQETKRLNNSRMAEAFEKALNNCPNIE